MSSTVVPTSGSSDKYASGFMSGTMSGTVSGRQGVAIMRMKDTMPTLNEDEAADLDTEVVIQDDSTPGQMDLKISLRTKNGDRRLSMASEAYDAGNKGYLNKEEQKMREMDLTGVGELTKESHRAAARMLLLQEKQVKQWRQLGMSLIVLALALIIAVFGSVIAGNEITKDTRPAEDGSGLLLTTKGGLPVATQSIKSYTSLFELTKFDTKTLGDLRTLTVDLGDAGGTMGTFEIAGAIKQSGTRYVSLLTADGSQIDIDGVTRSAMISVHGRRFRVSSSGEAQVFTNVTRGRALGTEGAEPTNADFAPGLHLEDDFFALELGRVHVAELGTSGRAHRRRRLQSGKSSSALGYATAAVSSAILDESNAAVDFSSGYYGVGQSVTTNGEVGPDVDTVFYENALGKRFLHLNSDGGSALYTDDMSFYFDSAGALSKCFVSSTILSSITDFRAGIVTAEYRISQLSLFPMVLPSVSALPFSVPTMDMCVDKASFDAVEKNFVSPGDEGSRRRRRLSHDEAQRLNKEMKSGRGQEQMKAYRDVIAHLAESGATHGRQLGGGEIPVGNSFAHLAWESYGSGPGVECEGNACVLVKDCNFAFRGTDDLKDMMSDLSVMKTAIVSEVGSLRNKKTGEFYKFHGGYHHEFMTLAPRLDDRVAACSAPNFIGHSLGGAMASVAAAYYGKGAVYSYGAPMPFGRGDNPNPHKYECALDGGERLFNEHDPVPGLWLGLSAGFWHGQMGTEIRLECVKRKWWGWCVRKDFVKQRKTCHGGSKLNAVNVMLHHLEKGGYTRFASDY